jgi:hypothetical protein
MKQITLSPEQKVALETRHESSSDRRECDRIKAILLRDENWPTPMIAQALRIHDTTVVRYIDAYAHDQKLTCNMAAP